jgi:dipeptidyl aminopeptidase/acylaminoacyl peptidase
MAATGAPSQASTTAPTIPRVSLRACPVEVTEIPTGGGRTTAVAVRRPPGSGRSPVAIHLHGGLRTFPTERLVYDATHQHTPNRFLAAGYVIVEATFAERRYDPLTNAALRDCLAVADYVKGLPDVDAESVVVWGNSGGGSLAMELAGETGLCAIAVEEPASVLFCGMYTPENLGTEPPYVPNSGLHIQHEPRRYYTPEVQQRTRDKIARIECAILLTRGTLDPINRINNEIIIPELRAAGKDLRVVEYAGAPHGFSVVHGPVLAEPFVRDC